jgi:molybdopterin-guanine dinucleotide biosynthesis protein A
MRSDLSAAILAGGHGRRLGGVAKGLILVDGKPIIARVAEMLTPFVGEIIIISNDPQAYRFLELPIFPDDEADRGPLQGIVTALQKAAVDRVLVVPCDMPYITESAIRTLLSYAPDAEAVVPLSAKGWEPLFAVYSRVCLPTALAVLNSGRRRVIELLPEVNTVYIPAENFEDSLWFNINNPADFQKAQAAFPTVPRRP